MWARYTNVFRVYNNSGQYRMVFNAPADASDWKRHAGLQEVTELQVQGALK